MSQIATPGTDRYSTAEFMAILIARYCGGDRELLGSGGANQVVSLAASRLAQLTVAPNLWLFSGGAGVYNSKFDTLPISTWDPRASHHAECKILLADVVDNGTKGRYEGDRISRGGAGYGGLQIDKYGNINMIGIGGPYPKMKVRGPGTVGTLWLCSGPNNLYVEHHNKKIFVERVDYRSAAGWMNGGNERFETLNGRDGPQLVWSPICVCDFTEDDHRMRLVSVHPGHTVEEVVENTGFELVIPDNVPETTPPTDWELEVLRTRVDRGGVLKKRRMTVG
ncbi:MAG TPA: CoA-transferase [Xanthobacteraceae bacterium]|nr:CoA-transferase [Xanthobacteraceae bacterium]